jgi:hypothetical protein
MALTVNMSGIVACRQPPVRKAVRVPTVGRIDAMSNPSSAQARSRGDRNRGRMRVQDTSMPSPRSRDRGEPPIAIAEVCETLKVRSEELRDTATQCRERATALLQEMRDSLAESAKWRTRAQ